MLRKISIFIILLLSPFCAQAENFTYDEAVSFPHKYKKAVELQNRDKHFNFFTNDFSYTYTPSIKGDETLNYAKMMNLRFNLWGTVKEYYFKVNKVTLKELNRGKAVLEVDESEVFKVKDSELVHSHDRVSIYHLIKVDEKVKIKSIKETKFLRQVL